jgi:hypothetical protein
VIIELTYVGTMTVGLVSIELTSVGQMTVGLHQ